MKTLERNALKNLLGGKYAPGCCSALCKDGTTIELDCNGGCLAADYNSTTGTGGSVVCGTESKKCSNSNIE